MPTLGIVPEVFLLSAQLVAGAKPDDATVCAASHVEALERHISHSMTRSTSSPKSANVGDYRNCCGR
jgi:hypothetical protein